MRSLILVFAVCWGLISTAQEKPINYLNIGDDAPEFNLPGTDDKHYTLADFSKYKLLAVIFTCNHCPTAQAYEDRIIEMVKQYLPKGVGFVAISPNDPKAISLSELGYSDLSDDLNDMKIRAKDKGYNFPYLYDGETQQVSLAYGPVATPHVFVFDQQRKLQYSGRIDDTEDPYVTPRRRDLVLALDQLLSGENLTTNQTKTFGCSIKWSWKDSWTKKLKEDWAKDPVTLEEKNLEEIKSLVSNSGNKYRLINLWATWCGPCLIEMPELVNTDRMYRGRDFEFITISTDKLNRKDKALELLTKMEAANQNYLYSGDDIYKLIDVVDKNWKGSLPYSLLVAPDGDYVYAKEGAIEPFELRKVIVKHLGRYYADD
jgi:thiol-disulfide isomerase/thioredoxin